MNKSPLIKKPSDEEIKAEMEKILDDQLEKKRLLRITPLRTAVANMARRRTA